MTMDDPLPQWLKSENKILSNVKNSYKVNHKNFICIIIYYIHIKNKSLYFFTIILQTNYVKRYKTKKWLDVWKKIVLQFVAHY